ncbi:MAG: hypothetical protein FWE62_00165 [Firmicutes bacterium]|nr:hypothetical protein [Bacillota bacterium]
MNIDFTAIIHQQSAYKTLLGDIGAGTLSHCYLLASPDTAVAAAIVYAAVTALYCPALCGTCPACRKVKNRSHADIKYFSGKLLAADVEKIVSVAEFAPVDGKYRIAVAEGFGTVTPAMQSKLLKTLEEPPRDAHFFLIADAPEAAVPTVRSRSKISVRRSILFSRFTK